MCIYIYIYTYIFTKNPDLRGFDSSRASIFKGRSPWVHRELPRNASRRANVIIINIIISVMLLS